MRRCDRSLGMGIMALVALCSVSASPGWAGEQVADIDAIVTRERGDLVSDDFELRLRALDAITAPMREDGHIVAERSTPRATAAITELLRCEFDDCPQTRVSGGPPNVGPDQDGEASEAESEYLANLMQAVMELHDPASVPLLYRPDVLTTGGMAAQALAYFGKTEAAHVVQLFEQTSKDPKRRLYHTALGIVIYCMLWRNNIEDPNLRAKLEAFYYNESFSPRALDRSNAVKGLSYFHLPRDRQRLEQIASSDPWLSLPQLDGKRSYTIRDMARHALSGPMDLNWER
jgi:hypothetical protein